MGSFCVKFRSKMTSQAEGTNGNGKLSGYLDKKGKVSLPCAWKRFWFVLDGKFLLFYKSKSHYESLGSCKGCIDFNMAQAVRISKGSRFKSHQFQVITRTQIIHLSASDENVRFMWVTALQNSIKLPQVSSPVQTDEYHPDKHLPKILTDETVLRKSKQMPSPLGLYQKVTNDDRDSCVKKSAEEEKSGDAAENPQNSLQSDENQNDKPIEDENVQILIDELTDDLNLNSCMDDELENRKAIFQLGDDTEEMFGKLSEENLNKVAEDEYEKEAQKSEQNMVVDDVVNAVGEIDELHDGTSRVMTDKTENERSPDSEMTNLPVEEMAEKNQADVNKQEKSESIADDGVADASEVSTKEIAEHNDEDNYTELSVVGGEQNKSESSASHSSTLKLAPDDEPKEENLDMESEQGKNERNHGCGNQEEVESPVNVIKTIYSMCITKSGEFEKQLDEKLIDDEIHDLEQELKCLTEDIENLNIDKADDESDSKQETVAVISSQGSISSTDEDTSPRINNDIILNNNETSGNDGLNRISTYEELEMEVEKMIMLLNETPSDDESEKCKGFCLLPETGEIPEAGLEVKSEKICKIEDEMEECASLRDDEAPVVATELVSFAALQEFLDTLNELVETKPKVYVSCVTKAGNSESVHSLERHLLKLKANLTQ